MTKPQNALALSAAITVTASTNNDHDRGHHHCFEQKHDAILTFEVDIDPPVDNINFVLWNLKDPANPCMAEPATDWPVQDGHVTIAIGPDPLHVDPFIAPLHLGPGPYCATLTASSSAAASATTQSAGKVVGNAIYYYETRISGRDCE